MKYIGWDINMILCYLRAPILFILNYKIRKTNFKCMMTMYRFVMEHVECGNKHCTKKIENKELILKVCKGCMSKRYCSKHCQNLDWIKHKLICCV